MKKLKPFICILLYTFLIIALLPACKSKKDCAKFDNPGKDYKAKYNKNGLMKKRR
jgi:hypothetical protein